MIDLKILVKNGVQFGHQAWRWSPKMSRFIWGKKNGVHLIDVSKTAFELDRAAKFLEDVAADGKQILWVGTKRAAQNVIEDTAKKLNSPFVRNRWIGGTLTNFPQVKKSVTKLLHYEDVLSKTDQYSYTKKEYGLFQKLVDRLESNVGGIRDLTWPVGAVVVIDARREAVAIKEAVSAGIPVVALVDTNSDPTGIDFVVPGNDDVARSIAVIVNELSDAVASGQKKVEQRKQELAAKEVEEKAQAKKEAEAQKASAPKEVKAKKTETKKAPAKAAESKKAAKEEPKKAEVETAAKEDTARPKKTATAKKASTTKTAKAKTKTVAKSTKANTTKKATTTKKKATTTKKADKAKS